MSTPLARARALRSSELVGPIPRPRAGAEGRRRVARRRVASMRRRRRRKEHDATGARHRRRALHPQAQRAPCRIDPLRAIDRTGMEPGGARCRAPVLQGQQPFQGCGAGVEPATVEISSRCSTRLSYPLASPAGFEPTTSGFVDRCSTWLSYGERVRIPSRNGTRWPNGLRARRSGFASVDRYRCSATSLRTPCDEPRIARRIRRILIDVSRVLQQSRVFAISLRASMRVAARSPRCRATGAWRWRHASRVALAAAPAVRPRVRPERVDRSPRRHSAGAARARRHASACAENKNPRKLASPGVFCTRGGLRRRPPVVGEAYAVVSSPRGIAQRPKSPALISACSLWRLAFMRLSNSRGSDFSRDLPVEGRALYADATARQ